MAVSSDALGIPCYHLVSHITVMFIPLSVLPKLQVGFKKKLSLCALFAVGVFCMVAAVMRMFMSLIDIASISPVLLWGIVEGAVVLMVANAPMLRVFF
jgi:hypothetical protein